MSQVTQILSQMEGGDPEAAERLFPLIYEELRILAASYLDREKPGQTLQATALVHDAYLRLVDVDRADSWESRGHFFAAAAQAMRRILVENARRKRRLKRGGDRRRVDLQEDHVAVDGPSVDILALDEALSKLAKKDQHLAELVKLRFFAGMTLDQVAKTLGISSSTAERSWFYARAWLYRELETNQNPPEIGEREASSDLESPAGNG